MIISDMIIKLNVFVVMLLLCMKAGLGGSVGDDEGKVRCIERERQALLQFKRGLIDDSGTLSSWASAKEEMKDCCKWRGVRCSNITGHVVLLVLHAYWPPWDFNNQLLRGNISLSLLELHHLKYLDLSCNDFEGGPIPEFIGSFSRLQCLNLSRANFNSIVPKQIGNLSELRSLDLGFNGLSVKNLEWLSHLSLLRYLDLSMVYLSKPIDWIQAISKLPILTHLHLRGCQLPPVIVIPPSLQLINSSVSLATLDLSFNGLTSSIYTWLFDYTNTNSLVHLDLSSNHLQGPIPSGFGNLNSLAHLDLAANQLAGGIPKSFGNLSNLQTLILALNDLSGQLPLFLHNLSVSAHNSILEFLYLGNNQLSGSLPDITMFSSLRELSVSENQLNGSFPKGFGQISSLVYLDLSQNQIRGSLPDLTVFSSLTELYLSNNMLNGALTQSIGQLFKLENLDLSLNSLQGKVSEAHFSRLSKLQTLDFSFNSLVLNFSSDWSPPFQIDSLRLASCQLGPYFPNWLRTQNNYSELDISGAGIFNTIPEWFWDLSPRLNYLNLSYNHISGVVPDLSSKFVSYPIIDSFPIIDFSSNSFECPIPLFPPNVTSLHLSKNMFYGSVSFLFDIASEFLSSIDLSDNRLSGELPDCRMHMPELVILNLANNNFSAKIPSSMGFLYRVQTLHLRNNNFTGKLPSSLKKCTELMIIDVGENKLSGKIPAWIGTDLASLIVLSLRLNEFEGHIPLNMCHLKSIQILDLSQSNISGIIPACFNNFTALVWRNKSEGIIAHTYTAYDGSYYPGGEYVDNALVVWKGQEFEYKNTLGLIGSIDLSSNRLIGKIPEEISSLAELVSLNLSRNYLTGHVTQKIGELKMLESLDLSRNQLSGEIPAGLTNLNFLAVLDLSNNNLSGKIPSSTQLQSFDASAYAGNLELCGLPLPKCRGDETVLNPFVTVHGEAGFINREFYVSMGLGFGVGFGGVCTTLLLTRSWEYVLFNFLNNIKDWLYVTTIVNMARLQRRLHI